MADASYIQPSFLGGEWSLTMQGRVDDPRYRTAMNVCFNGILLETGAWVRRPPFKFAGRTPGGRPARVVNFNFTSQNPYSMEFSDGLIRFRNGLEFVRQNSIQTVISVTSATPAHVRVDQPHGLGSGQYAEFRNLGLGMPTLQNRQFQVTVIDPYEVSIADDIEGPIDGSLVGALPAGVMFDSLYQINTSYIAGTTNSWENIRVVQAETRALLLNGRAPNIISVVDLPTETSFATFDFRSVTFVDGPYLDPYNDDEISLSSVVLTPSGTSGVITLTASQLNGGTAPAIFQSTDVGRQMRLFTAPPTWLSTGTYVAGASVTFNGQVFLNTSGVTVTPPSSQPDVNPTVWTLAGGLRSFWIYGVIEAVNSSTSVEFHILGPGNYGLAYTTPIEIWRLGVYSDSTGYPTCGCYHEGRVWLGGAISNRFDASMSNGLNENVLRMSPTAVGGTVAGSNGISYVLNAKDVNQMLWMEPDQQGIIIGTKGGEWLVQATTQNLALSPTNIQAHRYTTVCCADIEPRRTPLTLAFVQKFGRKVMEFFPDVFAGRFTAPNLTQAAKHLTEGGIAELAYQQELSPTIWVRRDDGGLVGCTYKRENLAAREIPTFAGWHRHAHGGGRVFESVTTAGNSDGTLDTLIAVTNDPATGIRWVEMLGDIAEESAPISAAWFADGSVRPSSYQIAIVTDVPVGLQMDGLWHLNGDSVAVWAGGLDLGDFTVVSGSITVPFGDGINAGPNGTSATTGPTEAGGGAYLLTPDFVSAFAGEMPIVVGFNYPSEGQILRPNSREESGARNGPAFSKTRRTDQFGVQVVGSQGLSFGTDFDKLRPGYFKDATGEILRVSTLFSGIHQDQLDDDYSFDSMLAWRVSRPYPATVLAIGGFIRTQDR